jgi:hypothetical protein
VPPLFPLVLLLRLWSNGGDQDAVDSLSRVGDDATDGGGVGEWGDATTATTAAPGKVETSVVGRWFDCRQLLVVLLLPPALPLVCLEDDCAVATAAGPVRVATMIRGGLLEAVLIADLMADLCLAGAAQDKARAMSSSSDSSELE